jgi:hypothetical protein
VVKEAENKEQSKRKQFVEREDRGGNINKEDGSRTTQQEKKFINKCFGTPHRKEGKIGWRSPEIMGQVDLGF